MNYTLEPLRIETGRPMLLGGVRRQHAYADAGLGIPAQWQSFLTLGRLPGQRGATTYGVMCGADQEGFEYMCAVEVASLDELPPGLGRMRVEEQQYAVFLHPGPVTTLRMTWEGIYGWLGRAGWLSAQRPDFEVYDARYDPATGLGGVEIRVAVRPADGT